MLLSNSNICYYPTVIKAILIALNILAQTSSESQDPQWQVIDQTSRWGFAPMRTSDFMILQTLQEWDLITIKSPKPHTLAWLWVVFLPAWNQSIHYNQAPVYSNNVGLAPIVIELQAPGVSHQKSMANLKYPADPACHFEFRWIVYTILFRCIPQEDPYIKLPIVALAATLISPIGQTPGARMVSRKKLVKRCVFPRKGNLTHPHPPIRGLSSIGFAGTSELPTINLRSTCQAQAGISPQHMAKQMVLS